ncbi:PD-(D/E)XK nuclease [Synechococcus phage S-SZBM1]|uniref:PD-(D/E)XK nuclease n=1 Tax=Synechococcus phage S-SZBM1 TaxID=2926475 RepID=A0AC61TSI7_9CAUD|nr:exonuclease [Synechococcus phage S-SZBM1]UNH61195.1 PD-(D/E)XK nuclease [Synechococcus phage S-SZBM1]
MELESQSVNGLRFYQTPDGKWFPSVTTVVGHHGKQKIFEWEERVGYSKAEEIRRSASWRGTKYHAIVEHYLNNDFEKVKESKGLPSYLFGFSRKIIDRIDNIHLLEAPLYSNDLRIAGRVDCIAEFDGELAIIDFKTTKELKKISWLEKYFVQEAAYAYMYWERTNCEVKKLVTLSVAENGETQVEQRYDKVPYVDTLCEWIKEFRYYMGGLNK